MNNADNNSNMSVASPLSDEYRNLHVKPWPRFFARTIDNYSFAFFLGIFLAIFFPTLNIENDVAYGLLTLFIWIFIEPVFLSVFGTTFGKFLFNIKVTDLNGIKPKFGHALSRSYWVWLSGLCMGFPIINLFALSSCYKQLKNTGTAPWDKNNFIVTHGKIGLVRTTLVILFISSLLLTLTLINEKITKPQNITSNDYSDEISKLNKDLPILLDKETELSKIFIKDNVMNYQYRMINKDVADFDKSMFYDYMRNRLIKDVCKDPDTRSYLARGENLSYNYMDKNGEPIVNILIKPMDCKTVAKSSEKNNMRDLQTSQSTLSPKIQNEIAQSVVNILCESTVPNERAKGGTGTIISKSGLIMTNAHIIPHGKKDLEAKKTSCIAVLPDPITGQPESFYAANPIIIPGLSDKYDLAYLKITDALYGEEKQKLSVYPKEFPAFNDDTKCNDEDIQLGEPIRIFGYPTITSGYSLTITDGVVSSFPGDGLIVTSAKVSHGNSGGIAVDKYGCMLGVPAMINSDESESFGIIISRQLVNEFEKKVLTYLDNKK